MMRTWEEKVKFKYGTQRPGSDSFEITVAGLPDDELNGVEDGFLTIHSFVPSPSTPFPNLRRRRSRLTVCGPTGARSKGSLTPSSAASSTWSSSRWPMSCARESELLWVQYGAE